MKKLLILFLTTFSFSHAMSSDMTWSSPTTLSTTNIDSSDPQVVIDGTGNITAVWIESGTLKSSSKLLSGSWTSAASLSGASASSPRLRVDTNGNVTALWAESGRIYSARLPFSGGNFGSWSSATAVSGIGGTATAPSLAVSPSGDAIAVWTRNGFIESATRLASLGIWGLASAISATGSDDNPSVAVSSNNSTLVAVWHAVVSSRDTLYYSTATVGGVWSPPASMLAVAPGLSHNYPKVALDSNGNATAVWFRYSKTGSVFTNVIVLSADLAVGASAWTAIPVALSNPGLRNPSQLFLRIQFDPQGNVAAFWNNSFDGSTFYIESAEKQAGQLNWSPPADLAGQNFYAFSGDQSVNPASYALLSYMFFDGTDAIINTTETDLAAPNVGTFSNPATISTGSENGFPRCASSVSGNTINAAVVWITSDGVNETIQAVTGTRTLVSMPTTLAVSQNLGDFKVFQDYYNTLTWSTSPSPNIQFYNVYRNGVFITTISATDPLQFIDHNTVQNGAVTYGVSAVDIDGSQSLIATVNFP